MGRESTVVCVTLNLGVLTKVLQFAICMKVICTDVSVNLHHGHL